jgi:hypothetical protein
MWRDRAAVGIVAVFVGAALYEAVLALDWISPGRDSGDDPTGQAGVTIAVLAAIAATFVVSTLRPRRWPFALVPVAAAAWMLAHYYAFDPYYLPTKRRYGDDGVVSPLWIYGVVVAAVGLSVASRRSSSAGAILTPLFVLVCLATVVAQGLGH